MNQVIERTGSNLMVLDEREVLGKEFKIYGTKDNPLFLAKDVANWIEHSAVHMMMKNVDEDEKVRNIVSTPGGNQEMWFLTEDGLYEVLMQSRKPIAKAFKKEVKSILKQIRKHGMFAADELLDNPDLLIAAATRLKEEREARIIAEKKIIELKPKAEFYDDVAGSKSAISIAEVAKVLGVKGLGRNKLFQVLRDNKILQSNNQPYQAYVDRGYFRVVEQKWVASNGETKINIKTLVYQKGVDYIRKLVK